MIQTAPESCPDACDTRTLPCVHCGEATTVGLDQHPESVFCCSGCRGAFELIRGWNLEQFYELRGQSASHG